RNVEFLENSLINQEASGSLEDLEIIQQEDTHPFIDTSLNHEEDDLEIDEPQSNIVPIRRSTRTRHAPDRMCLYIDAEEHELGDLGEPANYKAALLDPESEKWLNAMNVEIQSMKDNEVWVLVELPPNGKTVGSKWLFKKKANMDGVPSYSSLHVTTQWCVREEKQNPTRYGSIHDESNNSSKSFWDYALETATRILNMVPTKKFEKTPYEVWHGQAPKLSYLKVWGCEALVMRDTLTKPNKLEPRSIKCIFIGYPKETIENSLITQEASGSLEDLKIIQKEDTHPSIDTSLNHEEDNLGIDEPQSDIIPIRRSTRTRHAPDRLCLYIDAEEHELGDLGEPANYKAALLDLESDKWLNAMNVKIQSMNDNEETFSPVVDIRAIRILIAISAFYDYEIWQMDVKTAFFNGYLFEEVYMEQPECFVNPRYPNRVYVKSYLGRCFANKDLGEAAYILGIKVYRDRPRRLIGLRQSAYIKKILKRYHMENSKRESIPMQEKLRLSKSQGASTPAELKRMQNVPYALVVGDLHWTTVKSILKHRKNTKDIFLVYEGDIKQELMVYCYTDTGYLTDADDLKSQTGYVFVLNGGGVDRNSAKPSIFATSSVDAKYIAAFDASKEAVWVRIFIYGLRVIPTIEEPISMYYDNTGAITIANESGITKGARHFRAKVHYLREVIEMVT
nr:hypothetical protein [Tanacetum cinerariifolium]